MQLNSMEDVTGDGQPVTLIACVGSVTRIEARRLRDQLRLDLRYGPRHLLLDLSEVDAIDHLAVMFFLETHRRSLAARCTFILVAPSGPVMRRLRVAAAHRKLVVHPTLIDALTFLEAAQP
jgi:anti-anti-sigma regulatory factor